MNLNEIKKILEKERKNPPSFRLKQVKKALFQDLIENWDEVGTTSTLPKKLRLELLKSCPIQEIEAENILTSKDDDTIKTLFKLKDDLKIESVLMKHKDGRRTVCVSCQVGCPIGCRFCATGKYGFKRNLSPFEIVEQVLFFARLLKRTKDKVSNVVFMGMGEPFLNYDNVLEAIRILNDKEGFNLGARHISISTVGIVEGIKKLSYEKLQINLAISLHAPNNSLRAKLMPINKNYPIEKILAEVDNYIKKTNRRVMFEYLMIDRVNDSEKEAEKLSKIMKKPLYFVNLISFNPIGIGDFQFKPSSGWKIKKFKEVLEKNRIVVTQRYRFGREIKAACGQLTGS